MGGGAWAIFFFCCFAACPGELDSGAWATPFSLPFFIFACIYKKRMIPQWITMIPRRGGCGVLQCGLLLFEGVLGDIRDGIELY